MKPPHSIAILGSLLLAGCSPSEAVPNLTTGEIYNGLLKGSLLWSNEVKETLVKRWSTGHVPMILEAKRLDRQRYFPGQAYNLMSDQEKAIPGEEWKGWQDWLWKQEYEPEESYPQFKSDLYKTIDPRFEEYFDKDRKATIRLDEVLWGGVFQDGIPPLRKPKMISAKSASYLAGDNIVFGIEVDGDARAYPKRILAWHEMFVDTIKGVPLAGVY